MFFIAIYEVCNLPVSSVVDLIAIGEGGMGFDSRVGQIGHSAPTTRHRCDVSLSLTRCVAQALTRGDGPATRYTLRCNATSIMKIYFDFTKLCRLLTKVRIV